MTGIDDPFEPPERPELRVPSALSPDEGAAELIATLERLGVL
jgi:adenylylsulfate kinase-like enzyme